MPRSLARSKRSNPKRSGKSSWCLARYKDKEFFYPGRIVSPRQQDGTWSVQFDDGDFQNDVPDAHILGPGSRVRAAFNGGDQFYPGVLERINADGSCAIKYDDGDKESHVASVDVQAEQLASARVTVRAKRKSRSPAPSARAAERAEPASTTTQTTLKQGRQETPGPTDAQVIVTVLGVIIGASVAAHLMSEYYSLR